MFGIFKKKNKAPSRAEISVMIDSAQLDVSEKWKNFCQIMKFNDGVSLAEQIDIFAQPIQEFMINKYPLLMLDRGGLFWSIVFYAVLKSGTHTPNEVTVAEEQLAKKHTQPV